MVVTSSVPAVFSILASVVGRFTPGTILKLTKAPVIIVLSIMSRRGGIISIGQTRFTSFDPGLLNGRLNDKLV